MTHVHREVSLFLPSAHSLWQWWSLWVTVEVQTIDQLQNTLHGHYGSLSWALPFPGKSLTKWEILMDHLQHTKTSFRNSWFTVRFHSANYWWWGWVNLWWGSLHLHRSSQIQLYYQEPSGNRRPCKWQNVESNPISLAMVFITYQEAHNFQCMFDN